MNTSAQHRSWVLAWQIKLHKWATTDKTQKYADVYNLVYDLRTLQMAWGRIKANRGSKTAGVDGETRTSIEAQGAENFLQKIHQDLKKGTYRPQRVREKGIPKSGGKIRRLGIPTLRDRVVQQALKMVLEPIFEADFYRSSYAYRPGRRAQDAIQEIYNFTHGLIGYEWIVEGDIQGCFDNVHHGVLLEEIRKRVTDRKVLHLIRAFLTAGVMTELGEFRRTITGTPQGGILSPLLANVYLSRLDNYFRAKWESYGTLSQRRTLHRKGKATAYLVRFADDFVILVRGNREQTEALKEETAQFLRKDLRMELSWEKTHITHMTEGFDFLGFHFVLKANYRGRVGVRVYPSKKSLGKVTEKVKQLTSMNRVNLTLGGILSEINPVLRGWVYYFRFAHSKKTFSYLRYYSRMRVFRWMRKKHPKLGRATLVRRHCPNWDFRVRGLSLFNPAEVRVERYGYRGARIPTPWNQEPDRPTRKRRGDWLTDERMLLENMEVVCST